MSEIRHPGGPGTPYVSRPASPTPKPGTAQDAQDEPEAAPEDSRWQTVVVRVSTMLAVWLGY